MRRLNTQTHIILYLTDEELREIKNSDTGIQSELTEAAENIGFADDGLFFEISKRANSLSNEIAGFLNRRGFQIE